MSSDMIPENVFETYDRVQKWDLRFLRIAQEVACWSKDPSTQVGAAITDGIIPVSYGFNGFPQGCCDAHYHDRERKYRRVIHAELNAIFFASRNLKGCTLYCTHPVCSNCAAAIIQNGIRRVVYISPTEDMASRWEDSIKEALELFEEARISYKIVERGMI